MRTDTLQSTRNETSPVISGHHAVMLIDFQYDFLADDGKMPVVRNQVSAFIATTQLAVASARKAGDPINAIGNEFRPSDRLMVIARSRGAASTTFSGDIRSRLPRPSIATSLRAKGHSRRIERPPEADQLAINWPSLGKIRI
jgi:nicotinamidase-related amidase